MSESLCQDCLRVGPADAGKCDGCGGDACAVACCAGCARTLALLRRGERDWRTLCLQGPILDWTAEDGILRVGGA